MAVKKERIPAEMFDKMQYILRNYYDGTMHSVFYYDKTLNEDVVKKAVTYVVENFKIYHSTFHKSLFRSYWEVNENYTEDDYFKFIDPRPHVFQLCPPRREFGEQELRGPDAQQILDGKRDYRPLFKLIQKSVCRLRKLEGDRRGA